MRHDEVFEDKAVVGSRNGSSVPTTTLLPSPYTASFIYHTIVPLPVLPIHRFIYLPHHRAPPCITHTSFHLFTTSSCPSLHYPYIVSFIYHTIVPLPALQFWIQTTYRVYPNTRALRECRTWGARLLSTKQGGQGGVGI